MIFIDKSGYSIMALFARKKKPVIPLKTTFVHEIRSGGATINAGDYPLYSGQKQHLAKQELKRGLGLLERKIEGTEGSPAYMINKLYFEKEIAPVLNNKKFAKFSLRKKIRLLKKTKYNIEDARFLIDLFAVLLEKNPQIATGKHSKKAILKAIKEYSREVTGKTPSTMRHIYKSLAYAGIPLLLAATDLYLALKEKKFTLPPSILALSGIPAVKNFAQFFYKAHKTTSNAKRIGKMLLNKEIRGPEHAEQLRKELIKMDDRLEQTRKQVKQKLAELKAQRAKKP